MDLREIIAYCFKQIVKQQENPLLIGITGESGCGKSFFSKSLREMFEEKGLPYTFLNHDDFLIPRKDREALKQKYYSDGPFKGKSYWEILENWYDLDGFQKVLEDLKRGKTVRYQPYLRDTGAVSPDYKELSPNRYILLENKLFLEKMDFIIELDVPRDIIIQRKIVRDGDLRSSKENIEIHEKVQGYFWDREKPHNANIIIDNIDYEHPLLVKRN